MTFSASHHAKAIDLIAGTPFEPELWPEVMALLSKAGGGWSSHLLGWHPANGAAFNFTDGLSEDLLAEWLAFGGLDPSNPRGRVWRNAPSAGLLRENDYSTEEERRRSPIYQEFFDPQDAPFSAGGVFDDFSGVRTGLMVQRSHSQDYVDENSLARLNSLLPHLRSALRLKVRLDQEADALVVGAFDKMRLNVLLCDRFARVVVATSAAETSLQREDLFRIRAGRIEASDPSSDRDLQSAIKLASPSADRPLERSATSAIILRQPDGRPCVADVAPLPAAPYSLRLGGVVLVSLRTGGPKRPLQLLKRAYGLTDAEADVAQRLAAGARIADVAAMRGVTVETVRNQVKALFTKMEVSSQAAVTRAVNSIMGGRD